MSMKMLFFASHDLEVEQLSRDFINAGIPCEIRKTQSSVNGYQTAAEVWVRSLRDCERALTLCQQRNLGFARSTEPTPPLKPECCN